MKSETCLFCKIAAQELPTLWIYSDEEVVAFEDIHPKAPHHFLVIPRQHIATLNDLDEKNHFLIGRMAFAASKLAEEKGFSAPEKGYRLVMNCHAQAGQSVFHIHMHVLAGRDLTWPPG